MKWLLKPFYVLELLGYFLVEMIKSNIQVAIQAVAPMDRLHPAIVRLPLSVQSDMEILLLANLITLTPGTLSLDVSEDKSALYVHVINTLHPDETIASIQEGFERRIRKVFE